MAEDSLVLKLAAQVDGFQSDLQKALGSWDGFLGGLSGGKNILGGLSIGIAAVGAAAFGLAKAAADTGDELINMSERTGISVRDLSLLKFAAEQSDTNIQTLSFGFKQLSRAMVEAQDSGSKQAAVFDSIGVSTKNLDGSLRPMKDVVLDVADRFKEIEDPTLKSALAMEVFGKAGVDLVPFLNQGGDAILDLMAKGESLGAAWDELSANQAAEFNDSFDAMKVAAGSLAKEIGVAVMPAFTTLMNFMTEVVRPIFGAVKAIFLLLAADATTLASAFAALWLGATKVSDALGITTNASQGAKELFDALRGSAEDLRKQSLETFDAMVVGAFRSKEETKSLRVAQEELTEEQKKNIVQTINRDKIEAEKAKKDKERAKELKEHMAEEAKGRKILKEAVEAYGKSQEALGRVILENALAERREIEKTTREYGLLQEAIGRAILARAQKEQEVLRESRDDWGEWFNLTKDLTGTFKQFSFETFQFVKQSFGDAVADMVLRGGSLKDALKEIWNRILESFISMLVEMGIEYVAKHAIIQAWAASHPIIQPTILVPVGGPGGAGGGVAGGVAGAGAGVAGAGTVGAGTAAGGAGAAGIGAGGAGGTAATVGTVGPTTAAGAAAVTAVAFVAWDPSLIFGGREGTPEERMANFVFGQIVQQRRSPADALALIKRNFPDPTIDWELVRRIAAMHIATKAGEVRVPFTLETIDPTIYGLAKGGIVTKAMLAMVGEAGPEAVIPLNKMGQVGLGGGNTFHFSFPNITSFDQFSVPQVEQLLKSSFFKAAENLNRAGYRWPMQPRVA